MNTPVAMLEHTHRHFRMEAAPTIFWCPRHGEQLVAEPHNHTRLECGCRKA